MQRCLCTPYVFLQRLSRSCIRVYSKYQYSIFVSLDIRVGRAQRRKESEFAIRVSGWDVFYADFAFSPHLYYTSLSSFSTSLSSAYFPTKLLSVTMPNAKFTYLFETLAVTKDITSSNYNFINLLVSVPGLYLNLIVQQNLRIKSILINFFPRITRYNSEQDTIITILIYFKLNREEK